MLSEGVLSGALCMNHLTGNIILVTELFELYGIDESIQHCLTAMSAIQTVYPILQTSCIRLTVQQCTICQCYKGLMGVILRLELRTEEKSLRRLAAGNLFRNQPVCPIIQPNLVIAAAQAHRIHSGHKSSNIMILIHHLTGGEASLFDSIRSTNLIKLQKGKKELLHKSTFKSSRKLL